MPADATPTTTIPLSINQTPGNISILDLSTPQPTKALYLFQAELIP